METIESSTNGILFCDISDHLPVFHIREFKDQQHKTKPEMEIINKRIINDSNVKSFGNTIKTTSWEDVISNSNTAESYNEFFNKFSTAYEKNFPLTKKVSKRKFDKSKSPWMTKCIAKSVQKKNKLYKKFLNCPVIKNEIIYRKYKNKLNHVKKKYYEEQLIKYKHNTKCLWKTINEIMNKHRNDRILPNEFNGDSSDEIINDPCKIANKFNEYFVNIGPGLAKKLPDSEITFDKYLTNKNNNNFFY